VTRFFHTLPSSSVTSGAGQVARGEVVGLERGRPGDTAYVTEALGGRPLDHQPRRPVGLAPHDRAVAQDVAALHAERHLRPRAVRCDDRRCLRKSGGRERGGGERAGAAQQRAPGDGTDQASIRHGMSSLWRCGRDAGTLG
jgi:hypothetical protein